MTPDPRPSSPAPIEPLSLFEILVRENADALTAFLRASVEDRAIVDDLFQETLLVAWRRIADYDRSRPFGAWLRGIAHNLVFAYYRQAPREIAWPGEAVLTALDDRLSRIERQPGDAFDDKLQALRECLEQLPPHFRESIELHYRQARSAEWIAHTLHVTREAIQKRLQRARLQLADCLRRKQVFEAIPHPEAAT